MLSAAAPSPPPVLLPRRPSFEAATHSVSHYSGLSLGAAARCLVATLVIFLLLGSWALGPHLLLGVLRIVDLPDYLPLCDGTQFFIACECRPGTHATGATWRAIVSRTHCKLCDVNSAKAERGNGRCVACSATQFANRGAITCSACKPGHTRVGEGGLGPVCKRCPANTALGKWGCEACKPDTTSAVGATQWHVDKGFRATPARDSQVFKTLWDEATVLTEGSGSTLWRKIKRLSTFVQLSGSSAVAIVSSNVNAALEELLRWLYAILFGLEEEFKRAFHGDGGAKNGTAWDNAEERTRPKACPKAPQGQQDDCPFSSNATVVAAMRSSPEYAAFERAGCKKDIKAAARRLSLGFHPDRFRALFRACDENLSAAAFTEIRNALDKRLLVARC